MNDLSLNENKTLWKVIPFGLIKGTEFNENKFSRTRRLIEQ